MTALEQDRLSRQRIITETDKNFFVEAGAGSGKTTMLINRMVAMVEQGCDISRISAITFTRAAANEFYERFQQKLIERSTQTEHLDTGNPGQLLPTTDETRERCRKALENIDLCFMGTIDSFCIQVLSEHPAEAGVPSDASIVSDEDAAALYKRMYKDICNGVYGDELKHLSQEFRRLYWNHVEVFTNGIPVFMGNRNVHFNFTERNKCSLSSTLASDRTVLLEALQCLHERPELRYTGKNAKNDSAWEALPGRYHTLKKNWTANIPAVISALKGLRDLRLVGNADLKYAASVSDVFEPHDDKRKWMDFNQEHYGHLTEELEQQRYELTLTFLMKCVPILEQAMRDRGWMTYFDCLYYLRNMLRKDAAEGGKLINYIYQRHSYVLIDEFQDTNPLQAEVFFYLTSEHPVPEWQECTPRPGSLFIVGDPKQSIYRFRSADVRSFLTVKHLFRERVGDLLTLSQNFRSTRTVCEYFNDIFSEILPSETSDQSAFTEIPLPEERSGEFTGVFKYKAYLKESDKHPFEETDPARIAGIIRRLVDREEYRITTQDNPEPRPIRYSDFMVITAVKSDLDPIMAHLRELEIPMRVEGNVEFSENEALQELCRIYQAAVDPSDDVAKFGALMGKLRDMTDEEYKEKRYSEQLVPEAAGLSPAALFVRIMEDYRIYNTVEADNLEVLYYSLELLRNAEKSGTVVTLKEGAMFLQNLLQETSGEERCLSFNSSRDCVHLANLHKVKGLEAPIVILAGKKEKTRFDSDIRIEHGKDSSGGYIFTLKGANAGKAYGSAYCGTGEYEEEAGAESISQQAEADRLVYVAATRARNVLLICESMQDIKSGEKVSSRWKKLLDYELPDFFAVVKPAAERDPVPAETEAAESLYQQASESSVLQERAQESASYALENPSKARGKSRLSDETEPADVLSGEEMASESDYAESVTADDTTETRRSLRVPANILGTMVHRLMEMLVSSRNKIPADEAAREIAVEYLPSVIPSDHRDPRDTIASLINLLTEVAETMRFGGYPQENGLPSDILSVLLAADEVYCEVPFCYQEAGENGPILWNGVMDVVYRIGDQWHILDYKTNANGTGLCEKYQEQMEAYEKAFLQMEGEKAEAKTYHVGVYEKA